MGADDEGGRPMKSSIRRRLHSILLIVFAAVAAFIYVLLAFLAIPEQLKNLSQAVADALVVAIVVSIVVEPHLLRYFGEELGSFGERLGTQTFWSSFYSRAPKVYIDAIKSLANADQFSASSNWIVSFDWVDAEKAIVKLSIQHTNYRENRSPQELQLITHLFLYESPFDGRESRIYQHAVICEAIEFYSDLLQDGHAQIKHDQGGSLRLEPSNETASPYAKIPPGARFTILTRAETYVSALGYFPLITNLPVLRLTVQLKGDALQDLYVSIRNHGAIQKPPVEGKGKDLAGRGPIQIGDVWVTGQAAMLSWAPIHRSGVARLGQGHSPRRPPSEPR
jgi:hypothetical protein